MISLEEAVRKMTSMPAEQFKFSKRGLIKEGYIADLVIFNPDTVCDQATFSEPHQYATGIAHVLVSGEFVVKDGVQTETRPGKVLRSQDLL